MRIVQTGSGGPRGSCARLTLTRGADCDKLGNGAQANVTGAAMATAICGGAKWAAAAKGQMDPCSSGECAGRWPGEIRCAPCMVQMTSGPSAMPPGSGIQPTGNNARRTMAQSASVSSDERAAVVKVRIPKGEIRLSAGQAQGDAPSQHRTSRGQSTLFVFALIPRQAARRCFHAGLSCARR